MESSFFASFPPSLPADPLEGEVCTQYIRCGKSGCRCQSGHLHGPYYYRIWREGMHVNTVKAACEAHRDLTHSLHDIKQTRMRLTQSIQKEWRRTQRLSGK